MPAQTHHLIALPKLWPFMAVSPDLLWNAQRWTSSRRESSSGYMARSDGGGSHVGRQNAADRSISADAPLGLQSSRPRNPWTHRPRKGDRGADLGCESELQSSLE
jgi:hypothetical protein